MSGLEVLGAISSIISVIDASIKIYNAVAKDVYFSPAIHRAAAQLPLVQDTLAAAMNSLSEESRTLSASTALRRLLIDCDAKVARMDQILSKAVLSEKSGRWRKIGLALNISRDREVDELMKGILADLQVLVTNHIMKSSARRRAQGFLNIAVVDEEEEENYKFRDASPRITLNNVGPGLQIAHTEAGNMNLNVGSGTQANINGGDNSIFYF